MLYFLAFKDDHSSKVRHYVNYLVLEEETKLSTALYLSAWVQVDNDRDLSELLAIHDVIGVNLECVFVSQVILSFALVDCQLNLSVIQLKGELALKEFSYWLLFSPDQIFNGSKA